MTWKWRLALPQADIYFVGVGDAPPERAEPMDGWLAAAELARRGTDLRGSLHAELPYLERPSAELRESLHAALVGGVIRAFRRPRLEISRRFSEPDEPIATEPVVEEDVDASWIEIELVDMEDQPVGNERYELVHPDGTVSEGVSSPNGHVRIPVTASGTCKLTFVDLDQEAWEPA